MLIALWLFLGLLLGAGFIAFERAVVTDERLFFAIGLWVVGFIYLGFAAIGDGTTWPGIEALGIALYGGMGILGMFRSPRWLVVGWAAHPVWDIALHFFGDGSAFTPEAYSISCVSFDLLVAVYIATRLKKWHGTNLDFETI